MGNGETKKGLYSIELFSLDYSQTFDGKILHFFFVFSKSTTFEEFEIIFFSTLWTNHFSCISFRFFFRAFQKHGHISRALISPLNRVFDDDVCRPKKHFTNHKRCQFQFKYHKYHNWSGKKGSNECALQSFLFHFPLPTCRAQRTLWFGSLCSMPQRKVLLFMANIFASLLISISIQIQREIYASFFFVIRLLCSFKPCGKLIMNVVHEKKCEFYSDPFAIMNVSVIEVNYFPVTLMTNSMQILHQRLWKKMNRWKFGAEKKSAFFILKKQAAKEKWVVKPYQINTKRNNLSH